MYKYIIFVFMLKQCLADNHVIYSLNETEYTRLPPLYSLEDYETCLQEPGGTYCVMDVNLFADESSELMNIILAYSAQKVKHFNHTQIHRGVCVTKTCKDFEENNNKGVDLNATLQACLNNTLWRDYQIQGNLAQIRYCKREGETDNLDVGDVIVAVVLTLLILINVGGSFYDILYCEKEKSGNPYLLAFSMKRNWRKLTAASGVGPEPRLERLKLFNGLRTMTMICVLFSHTVLMMAFAYVANPLYIEKSYEDPLKQILFNGSLVTHTFFVMSSFLLAYNFQLYMEKHEVSWTQWPKGVLLRWLRLTPTYALVLAVLATWMRHAGNGPLWDLVVGSEAAACRQYWWAHVLYINNYLYDDAFCAPQTWYLAADTQLFCLGLLLCVMVQKPRSRKIALLVLMVVALVIPAAHTYFQNLDAVVLQSPESYRSLYQHDDTFRLLYIRGHTNLSTYILGLAGGFLTYYWQKDGSHIEKYKKHRWVVWTLFPLAVGVILTGGLFYIDGSSPSTILRVLYATVYKPIFQIMVVMFIIGGIFKFENIYRCIVEWRGFTWTGRVSYSAFLLHTLFQRGLIGAQTQPIYMSDFYVLVILMATIFLSFTCGAVLWLCLEAPLAAVTKAVLSPRGRGHGDKV